jgi:glutathione S-transferase
MVAKHLQIPLVVKNLDYLKGEHLSPEFEKLNPLKQVPTLEDNGYVIYESHAILRYLVNKYAPASDLYPQSPEKRGRVDFLLHYDDNTIDKHARGMFYDIYEGKDMDEKKQKGLKEALIILDSFLGQNKYVAGNGLTLADISIHCTLTFLEPMGVELSPHENVYKWFKALKEELPYYKEINDGHDKALDKFMAILKQKQATPE